MKVERWLKVELKNGETRRLDVWDMRRIFQEFGLPLPDTNKVVISMNFREMVLKYGLTFIEHDTENFGQMLFVPPSRIKNIRFFIDSENKDEDQPPK